MLHTTDRSAPKVCADILFQSSKVPDKAAPNVLFATWLKTFFKAMFMPVVPRLFQIGFTYAQPFLITAAIELAATPQTQPYNNNGYGLIGAYILVYSGIAVWSTLTAFRRWPRSMSNNCDCRRSLLASTNGATTVLQR